MAYRYVSGDSHLEVDSSGWVARLPTRYRDRAPRLVHLDGTDAWFIDGKHARNANAADVYGGKGRDQYVPDGAVYETTPGTGSPEQRLTEQDQDGVDAEVLYPGQVNGPKLWRLIEDDETYEAMVSAYNEWLASEYCAVNPSRLIGVGILPLVADVDAYIAEMEHCKELGLKTVLLQGFPSGHTYPALEDDRFFQEALDIGMPLTVHVDVDRSQKGPLLRYANTDEDERRRLEKDGRSLPEQVARFGPSRGSGCLAAAQWVLSGLFDRMPKVKIFFAENQIGWIPSFLQGADVRYERNRHWAERYLGFEPLAKPPSEYILEHYLWGFQYDRVGVEVRHLLTVDNLIWGSDFPHQESDWPYSMDIIEKAFAGAPDDVRYKMTCGNAIDFFGLED